ncbi:hypothetical protein HDU67_009944 [Dinochytrium kinnereticum]|nr:hypothetical protein HDU67_009944 [Dinochytrium kinnereticum]
MSSDQLPSFPEPFLRFLTDNGIGIEDYQAEAIPRYIRLNPGRKGAISIKEIEEQLGSPLKPIEWLPDFFSIPSSVKINGSRAFQNGDIYGMDISSGVAVYALSVEPNDHVLDLCCAPGGKMCLVADLQGNEDGVVGTVTGVDVSSHRIATCRSVLRKYKIRRARLFLSDGTTFNVHAPSRVGKWTRLPPAVGRISDESKTFDQRDLKGLSAELLKTNDRKHPSEDDAVKLQSKAIKLEHSPQSSADCNPLQNAARDSNLVVTKSLPADVEGTPSLQPRSNFVKPFHATQLLRGDLQIYSDPFLLYDKVLVDAECTHDGSISHLDKCDKVGWERFAERYEHPEKMDELEVLQPGGILVYRRQNEDIVFWLIASEGGRATIEAIPGSNSYPLAPALPALASQDDQSGMKHVLRFTPSASNTSGLFVARIRKAPESASQLVV